MKKLQYKVTVIATFTFYQKNSVKLKIAFSQFWKAFFS